MDVELVKISSGYEGKTNSKNKKKEKKFQLWLEEAPDSVFSQNLERSRVDQKCLSYNFHIWKNAYLTISIYMKKMFIIQFPYMKKCLS